MKHSWGRGYLCLVILMAVLLSACGPAYEEAAMESAPLIKTEEDNEETPIQIHSETTASEDEETEPLERVAVDGKIRSYLTGEMVEVEKADRRPIAIMMSNDKEARPQYGINRAGVVYEAPVEGGMNRFMAIIEDYDDLERIGSVRSCRTYYVYFAREFEAIYAHFGQSTFAKPYLKYVDNLNGIEGAGSTAYYRSKDKKQPHNAYASGDRLNKAIEKLGYSQEYPQSYQGHFQFNRNQAKEIQLENSLEAYTVYPGYAYNNPWFVYNEEDGLYHRYQYGGVHQGDEGPIAVKNILFQYCPTGHYATTAYLDITVHNSTKPTETQYDYGYYFTNGRGIPISWEKDGDFGVTHYYDMEHKEITLNQGKTWICIIPTSDFDKTKIHGKDS